MAIYLREDQGFVAISDELDDHLVQDLELAADVHHVGARVIEHAVRGEGILDEVGVVDSLPHVHHPTLHGEVLRGSFADQIHLPRVRRLYGR